MGILAGLRQKSICEASSLFFNCFMLLYYYARINTDVLLRLHGYLCGPQYRVMTQLSFIIQFLFCSAMWLSIDIPRTMLLCSYGKPQDLLNRFLYKDIWIVLKKLYWYSHWANCFLTLQGSYWVFYNLNTSLNFWATCFIRFMCFRSFFKLFGVGFDLLRYIYSTYIFYILSRVWLLVLNI